jgi:hypothetical protein
MQLALAAKPTIDVFSELTNIPWVRYTLMMPGAMRMISPLCAAMIEEVFFRGAIFLILIIDFPEIGAYLPIFVCTALSVLQQVLQTGTLRHFPRRFDVNFRCRLPCDIVHGKFPANTSMPCGICVLLPSTGNFDVQK